MHLTSAIARNTMKLQAIAPNSTLPMLESGIYRAAVCMTCNHKDLSSASLSCVAGTIGECTYVVTHSRCRRLQQACCWHAVFCICLELVFLHSSLSMACGADICNLQGPDATALVIRAGPSIVQGLLAALLAVSAVSRVHKVCSIFTELTGIQQSGKQSAADVVIHWLRSAIQQLPHGEIKSLH